MAKRVATPEDNVVDFFSDWLAKIPVPENRKIASDVLSWVNKTYPNLGFRFAWNQPMFTNGETFIIGFNTAKAHLSVAGEKQAIEHFAGELAEREISHGSHLMRLPWDKPIPYDFLAKIIDFNITDKADLQTFWRH